MTFRFVISNPKTGKTFQKELEKNKAQGVAGLKIGSDFDAGILGLPGYRLQITGGTDKDGFPMKKDFHGIARKRLLLSKGIGKSKVKGLRRRKMVCGNTITDRFAQINTKVVKAGSKPLDTYFAATITPSKGAEAVKEEPKAEQKPEESKEEPKAEEKPAEEEVKKEEKTKAKPEEEAPKGKTKHEEAKSGKKAEEQKPEVK